MYNYNNSFFLHYVNFSIHMIGVFVFFLNLNWEHVKKLAFIADADAKALTRGGGGQGLSPRAVSRHRDFMQALFLHVLIYICLKQEKPEMEDFETKFFWI